MFKRVLIANRGEIAVRIIRACRELGIESVAVYSDADERAPHAVIADRAVGLGAAPAAESYLSVPKIIDAARATNADAVHPGYGFLAEQAELADACERAKIAFVGPPADVIARMGSKLEARAAMAAAGIPIVPGEAPTDQSDAAVKEAASRLGYPVIIKASAGGGGKGMRVVRDTTEALDAIQGARREAVAAFGDGTLYVERYLDRPHHVEVQIFGDRAGSVVHLFERECSVQRRHQKIIEESPSPSISPTLRTRMCEVAAVAARAVGYVGAGTVEFLLDVSHEAADDGTAFYFLEMNTRLQVEHPVTEQVTGVDLVHAQLSVAAGEPLPWSQASLGQRGHAIEARVYAEDPNNGFLPQAGRLLFYREPRSPGIRVDSGVMSGGDVSVHYDPLIAKVIATAAARDVAVRRLVSALRDFPVLGVRTNIPFLIRTLEDPAFQRGAIDTSFLDREGVHVDSDSDVDVPFWVQSAVEMHMNRRSAAASSDLVPSGAWDPWATLTGWRG